MQVSHLKRLGKERVEFGREHMWSKNVGAISGNAASRLKGFLSRRLKLGLSSRILEDMINLKSRGALDDFQNVVEIGTQQLSNDFLRADILLDRVFSSFGRDRPDLGRPNEAGFANGIERQPEQNPSSRLFWSSLGFNYTSLEFGGHRNSVPLDLNRDAVPPPIRDTFDLVVNTGTTEHVANQDNAFRVMHDLCKVGGLMYHEVPAGGMMTHGLVTYTPKFFWHLCRENDYIPLSLRIISTGINPVHQDIRASNLQFNGEDTIKVDCVPDFMAVAILRKQHAASFRTPMDLPTAPV